MMLVEDDVEGPNSELLDHVEVEESWGDEETSVHVDVRCGHGIGGGRYGA